MKARILLAAIAGFVTATAAHAEVTLWKKVSGWDVSFYPSIKGCQAYTTFEQGTSFFIGFDASDDVMYLDVTLMDERWRSIESGKEYEISAKFGDETAWNLDMLGKDYGGKPGLNILVRVDNDKADLFAEEFQRETRMSWRYAGEPLGIFTLKGSRRAFQEVMACQRSYFQAVNSTGSGDPFARGDASDPFSR